MEEAENRNLSFWPCGERDDLLFRLDLLFHLAEVDHS
jgi:hypothetical protein